MLDQKLCMAVAGEAGSPLKQSHYETHADALAQQISGCVSLDFGMCQLGPPVVVVWGLGTALTHSECCRKPRRLSGVAAYLKAGFL